MKALIYSSILFFSANAFAKNPVSVKLIDEVPAIMEVSAEVYKKLHGGFQFKGYGESPGHQAILTEMKNYYQLIKKFRYDADTRADFPQERWDAVKESQERVRELSSFVILEDDIAVILNQWIAKTAAFSGSKEEKVKEVKIEKLDERTQKLEKAIEKEEARAAQPVDPEILAKEARLSALADHFRLLQKQNRAIIHAGYTTPSGFFPSFNGGYYYNNGTYYPRYRNQGHSSHCYPKRPILQINLK